MSTLSEDNVTEVVCLDERKRNQMQGRIQRMMSLQDSSWEAGGGSKNLVKRLSNLALEVAEQNLGEWADDDTIVNSAVRYLKGSPGEERPVWLDVTRIAAMLGYRLGLRHPGTRFSVKSRRYASGDSIRVVWTDGPPEDDVREVAGGYGSLRLKSGTDVYRRVSHWLIPGQGGRNPLVLREDTANASGEVAPRPDDGIWAVSGADHIDCKRQITDYELRAREVIEWLGGLDETSDWEPPLYVQACRIVEAHRLDEPLADTFARVLEREAYYRGLWDPSFRNREVVNVVHGELTVYDLIEARQEGTQRMLRQHRAGLGLVSLFIAKDRVNVYTDRSLPVAALRFGGPASGALWVGGDLVGEFDARFPETLELMRIEEGLKTPPALHGVDPLAYLLTRLAETRQEALYEHKTSF